MHFRTIAALLTLPLACSASTVDLDDSLIEASSDPSVVAVVRERVERMLVADERLYWAGSHLPRNDSDAVLSLRSCQKRNCAATLVTYDAPPYRLSSAFSVSRGEVFWHRSNPEEVSGDLVACPIAGCSGSPRTLASKLSFVASTFDDDRFYFSNSGLYSLSLSQPDPPHRLASFSGKKLLIHDGYAYGLVTLGTGNSSAGQPLDASGLKRIRIDGGSSVETIANDVKFSFSLAFGFTADTSSIYWTNNLLAGSINRCRLTGCTTGSDVVLRLLRVPQKLWIDGSQLYYVYEPQPYQYALSSCTLPDCAQSLPLIEHLDAPAAFATDDEHLYVATTEQDVSPSNRTENTVTTIRRLPKPHRERP